MKMIDKPKKRKRRFPAWQKKTLFLVGGGVCQECGTELQPGWHADHRHPFSLGGETELSNGQALCPGCNLKKGSDLPEE